MTTYTKVPNEILDSMADLKPAAFKLAMALCRLTYGYHRDRVEMSIRELAKMTGLAAKTVFAIAPEIDHIFIRESGEKGTAWVLTSGVQGVNLRYTGCTPEVNGSVHLRGTIYSGLKKDKENIKETTKESSNGSDSVPIGEIYTAYEDSIAVLDPIVSGLIEEAYKEFGGRLVKEAIVIAVTANKRSWRYVNGILKKWRTDGKNNVRPMVVDETGGFHV